MKKGAYQSENNSRKSSKDKMLRFYGARNACLVSRFHITLGSAGSLEVEPNPGLPSLGWGRIVLPAFQ